MSMRRDVDVYIKGWKVDVGVKGRGGDFPIMGRREVLSIKVRGSDVSFEVSCQYQEEGSRCQHEYIIQQLAGVGG